MTGVTHAGSIRNVISGPAVARTFALAMVGRLTYGLLPLCLLFTVRDSSGSFAVAAATSAALGFATLAMPLQARLIDRFGQRRVLPSYGVSFSALLVIMGFLAAGTQPDLVWMTMGLLLGLSAPALGPAMRAQWREIAPEGPRRRAAYSLDSVAEESLYLVGPLAASAVLATGQARLGLFMAAGLVIIGTTGLVISRHVPGTAAEVSTTTQQVSKAVLGRPRLLALLAVMVLVGAAGAACLVGVAAIADRSGVPSAAGAIEAVMAVGAIVGGLLWARLQRDLPWTTALGLLLTGSIVAQAGAAMASPTLTWAGVLLIPVGALAAPVFVVAFTGADDLVPPEQRTEASTWVSTAFNGGNALGTALAGLVLSIGTAAPFGFAACLTLLAATTTFAMRPRRAA